MLLALKRMLPKAIRDMLQTIEKDGYKEGKEYALKLARALRNERAEGPTKAGAPPLNELDHLTVPEGLSPEEQEAFVFAKKGKGKGKSWGWGKGQKGGPWGKGVNAVEEEWANGSWGWIQPQAPPASFLCALSRTCDSEGFAPVKRTAARVQHRDPVPLVQTRNRFTHLAGIREEENANEDIPICMVQHETAVEPYPAREDRIQERTTEGMFRISGKFNELGQEYKRLAEAKGG